MTPERWQAVTRILDRLLDADLADQPRLLVELCAGDTTLQADVEALLAAERVAGERLERPAGDCLEADEADLDDPRGGMSDLVGPWRPLSVLGRGGMGVVYLAERADGQFDQRVALKLVKRGVDTDEILERFRRERQILAGLDHPQIARLVDGGVTADGLPYFAMELVEGEPITTWCDGHGLGLEARLRLFRQVCDAVGARRHA
jgi:serine/threonine-protein kinase